MPILPQAEATEMQARVRAAMAYAGLGRDDIAPLVGDGVSPSTIDRYTGPGKAPPARPRRDYLEDIAAACGLNFAFFFADFNRLDEIATMPHERFIAIARAASERPASQQDRRHGRDRRKGDQG